MKYDTASVSIYIEDVNDSAPKFLDTPYHVRVVEGYGDINQGIYKYFYAFLKKEASSVYFFNQLKKCQCFLVICMVLGNFFYDFCLFYPKYLAAL